MALPNYPRTLEVKLVLFPSDVRSEGNQLRYVHAAKRVRQWPVRDLATITLTS